jgi:hypothetical protein
MIGGNRTCSSAQPEARVVMFSVTTSDGLVSG